VAAGLSAGAIIKEVAPIVGGGGGGKPQMARAGGRDPSRLGEALERAKAILALPRGA
jgi:alanyl-tRNA synthetase